MRMTHLFDEETERRIAAMVPGMAYPSGGGPDGSECRWCNHFQKVKSGCMTHPKTQKGHCEKFARMMRAYGPAFPAKTPGCISYEQG